MANDSTFGTPPERLRRLLLFGRDESDDNEQSMASWDMLKEKPGSEIGRYRLVEVIGEGGMGIVYLAEQEIPIRRRVALKIIKPGMDSKRILTRFEAERQALALLDHPNIAHVYDAGTTESGRPYFVMEYVKGLPITEYCDHHKLPIEDRLRLFRQVCLAVHHAHQKGIIHRDIKPSNILVSTSDDLATPKIIDFGVVKAITQPLTEQTLVTEQGQLFGTPEYMSPEQADMANEDIDTRSDIYSLGVLLYVLLTGVLPFDSKELRESGIEHIRQVIRETDPKTPSTRLTRLGEKARRVAEKRRTEVGTLARRLHNELEWIPLKAMRKERSERYRSASELTDDIENYLNGKPLMAGPLGKVYRTKKFIQRHKPWVIGVAAVLGVLIAGTVVSTAFYIMAKQRAEVYRRSLYVRNINLADKYFLENNLGRVRDLLKACPKDLREWEWYYLWRVSDQSQMTLRGHNAEVDSVVFSPDGKRIVSAGGDNTLKVWDADTGKELRTLSGTPPIAFSPDGKRLLSGSEGNGLTLWDAENGEELVTFAGREAELTSVAFSPDGIQIVSGSEDKTMKVWDADNGEELMTIKGHEAKVTSVAFSPDGRRIISGSMGSMDGKLRVWDANDGSLLKTLNDHGLGQIYSVAFSPDGTRIVFGGFNAEIKVFDANNYSELMTLKGGGGCRSIAFSPDGRWITAGSRTTTFKVWDAVSGSEMMILKGHKSRVRSVAFSPDGKRIASGSGDGTIKVWDLNSISDETTLHGHEGAVHSVAFSPDGGRIVSGCGDDDNTLKVWDAVSGSVITTLKGHTDRVWSVAFSPENERIVSASDDGTIKVWDLNSIGDEMTLQKYEGTVYSVAFSPDGQSIVSGSGDDNTIIVWDAVSGSVLRTLKGHKSRVRSVAFSPDGKRIVSGSENGTVKVWDAESYSELKTLEGHTDVVSSVAFSPNSSRIASGSWDNTLKIWDADSGKELRTFTGHQKRINSASFSPNGKRIVSCSDDLTLKVWDAESGDELVTLHGHRGYVRSVAFSPNSKRIVSAGSWEGTLKIWDIADPVEVEAELMAEEKGLSWIRRD